MAATYHTTAEPVRLATPQPREASSGRFGFDAYVAGLHRWRWALWAFILGWVVVGAIYGPPLIQHTTTQFNPPAGTQSYEDEAAINKMFPGLASGSALIVYVRSLVPGRTVLGSGLQQVTYQLNATLATHPVYSQYLLQFQGYYTLLQYSPSFANTMVSESGLASIITIRLDATTMGDVAKDAAQFIQTTADNLAAALDPQSQYTVEGISAMITTMLSSAEHDFTLVDGIAMPVALLVFSLLVRSLRMLVVPVAALGTSALVTLAAVNWLAMNVTVESFVPSLMMSILVAMNIDYSLFLLTRFREELACGAEYTPAVATMLRTAGRTVAVSGFTLCFCFFGLVLLPVAMMRTLGVACAMAIVFAMITAAVQTPLLLLTFPGFFSGRTPWSRIIPCLCCRRKAAESAPLLPGSPVTSKPDLSTMNPGKFWPVLGRLLLRKPWNFLLILVIVGATLPSDLRAVGFKTDDSMFDDLPRGARVTTALKDMSVEFGYGLIEPYVIAFAPSDAVHVVSQTFFNRVVEFVYRMSALPNTYPANFTSVAWVGSQNMSIPAALIGGCAGVGGPVCGPISMLASTFINTAQTGMWMQLTLPFDPLTTPGKAWYAQARQIISTASRDLHMHIYMGGIAAESLDAIDSVYDSFPMMVLVTASVVLVFVGVAFRSIVIPLRAIATIALTICFVFGTAAFVYQDNAFNFTGWGGLQGSGSIQWMVPITSFTLLVGIALDYDAFLLVRVQEAYREGRSTSDAVLYGLTRTGHIITAAGAIMAIAFGGLLFSSVSVLNQLSFYLVLAVLFDTLIVRALLVPAVMGVLGDANWWPLRRKPVAEQPATTTSPVKSVL